MTHNRLITIRINNDGIVKGISSNLHSYILTTPNQNAGGTPAKVRKENTWAQYDELLIEAIKNRPCIWNYNLPIQSRTPMILTEAWKDVVEDLEGKFDLDSVKKRWRNLKDSFRKAHKRATGETSTETELPNEDGLKDKFRFYEEMLFLKDSGNGRQIRKRFDKSVDLEHSSASLIASLLKSKNGPHKYWKRKRTIADTREFQKDILQIIAQPDEPAQELDGIDGFLLQLGESMRRLPHKERRSLEHKISSLVLESEEECQLLIVAE